MHGLRRPLPPRHPPFTLASSSMRSNERRTNSSGELPAISPLDPPRRRSTRRERVSGNACQARIAQPSQSAAARHLSRRRRPRSASCRLARACAPPLSASTTRAASSIVANDSALFMLRMTFRLPWVSAIKANSRFSALILAWRGATVSPIFYLTSDKAPSNRGARICRRATLLSTALTARGRRWPVIG